MPLMRGLCITNQQFPIKRYVTKLIGYNQIVFLEAFLICAEFLLAITFF